MKPVCCFLQSRVTCGPAVSARLRAGD
uniref:Uncharacterized protein n=1 Tax=Anguilla anguilla TaxID=7936 RepID=A0A0E9V9L3_ANGAN